MQNESTGLKKSCLVLISGGLDSVTAAYWAKAQGYTIEGIFFDYEHITRDREISCVAHIADTLDIPLHVIKVPLTQQFFFDARPFPGPNSHLNEQMHEMRLDILVCLLHWLTLAASFSMHLNIEEALVGITASDKTRVQAMHPAIFEHFGKLVSTWAKREFLVTAPFIAMDKQEVVSVGHSLGVPFESTWSCSEDNSIHCGSCVDCVMRRIAFSSVGIADPITYAV